MRVRVNLATRQQRKATMYLMPFLILTLSLGSPAIHAEAEDDPSARTQLTSGGLEYRQLQKGTGPTAKLGDVVHIHIVGWVEADNQRGREFFNSRQRGAPPQAFVLGTDRVMPAWNEGIKGMQAGGSRMLRVPPVLGFGTKGNSKQRISGSDTLLLRVTLVQLDKRM